MMKAPVRVSPREMFEGECMKRFVDGLKLAESCARELMALQPKRGWDDVEKALHQMRVQGHKLAHTKSLSRQALLAHTDQIANQSGVKAL